jgi:phage tail sheath gpL-like
VEGDTLAIIQERLVEIVDENDPEVTAVVGGEDNLQITLRARELGLQGTNISFGAFVSEGATLTLSTGFTNFVPRNVVLDGTPVPGETVTISLAETNFAYTIEEGDTLETVINGLVELMVNDPNVLATPDPSRSRILIDFRDPASTLTIPVALSVSEDSSLAIDFEPPFLSPGVGNATNPVQAAIGRSLPVVPGDILVRGTPQAGQTVTITLAETVYSYTTVSGDTLLTIVERLAEQINRDPNVAATANTTNVSIDLTLKDPNSEAEIAFTATVPTGSTLILVPLSNLTTGSTASVVSFAGLVPGSVGLYQVNFSVPADAQPNSAAELFLFQNLIVFGSVTETNIFSNVATFPIGQAPQ